MPGSRQHKTVERISPGGNPVVAGIKKAKEAWAKYQKDSKYNKNAVYGYLTVVFDLVQQWEKKKLADEYSLKALKQHEWKIKMKADPYARVIYCSSDADPKKRSHWAIIMQWVAEYNSKERSFTEFVTKNGGLNKCRDNAKDGFPPEWT